MKKTLKILSAVLVLLAFLTGCQKAEKTGRVEIVDLTHTITEESLFPARYKSVSEDFVVVFSDTDVPIRQYGDAENQYIILVTPLEVVVLRDSVKDSRLNDIAAEVANSIKGMSNDETVMPLIKTMENILVTEKYEAIAVIGFFIIFAALFTVLYLLAGGDEYGYGGHSTYCYYRGGSRASYGGGGSSHR